MDFFSVSGRMKIRPSRISVREEEEKINVIKSKNSL